MKNAQKVSTPSKTQKRDFENYIKRISIKTNKAVKKLNKTRKNIPAFKKCKDFCKNDYMVEIDKANEEFKNDKYTSNYPYIYTSKTMRKYLHNMCIKNFCNKGCAWFPRFYNESKPLNNGFRDVYSPKKIKMLKNKGAISGCSYWKVDDVYDR